MNLAELGFNLKCRREFKKVSNNRILLDMTIHELTTLENGQKCSLKVLMTYLDIIDASLMFLKGSSDHGEIRLSRERVTLYSRTFSKEITSFRCCDTIALLRYMNKYEYRVRIRYNQQGLNYQPIPYPKAAEWTIVKEINKVLLKRLEQSEISWEALASSIHMTKEGLENFFYGVINYDFNFVNIIAKKIGYIAVYVLKGQSGFILSYVDGRLYAVRNNGNGQLSLIVPASQYSLFSDQPKHKIEEIATMLHAKGFVRVFLAHDGYVDESLKEDNVDNKGQRPINKYTMRELDNLIKWRSNGIGKNLFCDYCRTRGPVKFYAMTDGRDIQLCKHCKDLIHPTNHYVNIIYTPTGGSNKRW